LTRTLNQQAVALASQKINGKPQFFNTLAGTTPQ